jgi:hypothetical protein
LASSSLFGFGSAEPAIDSSILTLVFFIDLMSLLLKKWKRVKSRGRAFRLLADVCKKAESLLATV